MDEKTTLGRSEESFLRAWRASEFYAWVIQMLDEEINATYVKDQVMLAAQSGSAFDSEEIGDLMKTEVQASLRIQSIKEKLE
jgi:uncharacterized protein YecA (UPF0149 family)